MGSWQLGSAELEMGTLAPEQTSALVMDVVPNDMRIFVCAKICCLHAHAVVL